jgi:hypothetical protein
MHDLIHAAIADERVRDLVATAEARRTARRPKVGRAAAAAPVAPVAPAPGRSERRDVLTAVLRLRRGAL